MCIKFWEFLRSFSAGFIRRKWGGTSYLVKKTIGDASLVVERLKN